MGGAASARFKETWRSLKMTFGVAVKPRSFAEFAAARGVTSRALRKEAEEWYRQYGPMDTMTNINIGIVGETGVGKSSFINAYLGEDKAVTGDAETTKVPTPYPDRDSRSVVLWDLPGANSARFAAETYFEGKRADMGTSRKMEFSSEPKHARRSSHPRATPPLPHHRLQALHLRLSHPLYERGRCCNRA
jgi:Interferon-inducible GTPase (IIGP)